MERRKFIKSCCYTAVGIPVLSAGLQSCEPMRYAIIKRESNQLVLAKSEFWTEKNGKKKHRSFVIIKDEKLSFPICVHKFDEENYKAVQLECTHRGCELNVGGGIYTCPCHGSEFSITGEVLEGPADIPLKNYEIKTDHENIYIQNP